MSPSRLAPLAREYSIKFREQFAGIRDASKWDDTSWLKIDAARALPPNYQRLAKPGHAKSVETVLKAYARWNPDVGYVQAMNLLASLLLIELDYDQEATFWALAALIKRLPPHFYAKAPYELLAFWSDAELLVLLAEEMLGLRHIRMPLLQVAPKWLLEWFIGTLPLPTLVSAWTILLDEAVADAPPSILPLRLALALLQLNCGQLRPLDSGSPAQLQASFELLQSFVMLSEDEGNRLLTRALELSLDDEVVKEMRGRVGTSLALFMLDEKVNWPLRERPSLGKDVALCLTKRSVMPTSLCAILRDCM